MEDGKIIQKEGRKEGKREGEKGREEERGEGGWKGRRKEFNTNMKHKSIFFIAFKSDQFVLLV